MIAELHSHTYYSRGRAVYSEGVNSPGDMIKTAKKLGIHIVAKTDHDTTEGNNEAIRAGKKYGIIVIPGEEVSTKEGHLLALGIQETIPPRISVDEALDKIHEQGGIGIAAHPFDVRRKGMRENAVKCDAYEVFNSLNIDRLANPKALKFVKDRKIAVTAGSDAHSASMIGYGRTFVEGDDVDTILKNIKKGKTSISGSYIPLNVLLDWSVTRLKISYLFTINYMNSNYRWPKKQAGIRLLRLVNKSPGPIDYLFKLCAYMGLGGVVLYSMIRNTLNI